MCSEHFIAVGQKVAEVISSTDESPIPCQNKIQIWLYNNAQIGTVVKRIINNKATCSIVSLIKFLMI